ncbi:MAG TPA: competence protein CoiA family protein [Chlamydiales bacterium]|nr:competence protein CoiA family protein [Chlamydiales bacterium]
MALYASDEESYIFAANATAKGSYRCLECRAPVKVRRGRNRVPHFYHLQKSFQCRLYSKSEDHLIVQLQLQKILSEKTVRIERPFLAIHRIADLLWEKESIVFEIQCSLIEIDEAKKRITDYAKIGLRVVWLLDDRIFNRKHLRAAEEFLRAHTCYYFTFRRLGSFFYDQMEIIIEKKRLKKGRPLKVDLSKPILKPLLEWPANLPEQIEKRLAIETYYFQGDVLHKTVLSATRPFIVLVFKRWKTWEIELYACYSSKGTFKEFFNQLIARPYFQLLEWLIRKTDK